MTRYTNFARKRTYVQAGFDSEPQVELQPESVTATNTQNLDVSGGAALEPEAKKRKRTGPKKTKPSDVDVKNMDGEQGEEVAEAGKGGEKEGGTTERPPKKAKYGDKRGQTFDKRHRKDANARKFSSEQRRLKRIDERNVDTVCFACREKGHTARDCRNSLAAGVLDGEQQSSVAKSGRDAVGICYRCGSRRHNLSRCKEPVDPENPLPFASCFVCSGRGHLASKCPKNQSRGIYPNGGCCKLCKETTHLAKDCHLRKQEVIATTLFVGTGREGGADEDDFHTFKRMTAEVNKTEKAEEKAKRKTDVRVGAHSGVVKVYGNAPIAKKKKVVFF